jgi:hypothetical protein
MKKIYCYKCKKEPDLPNKKIGFKQTCEFCLTDLHACVNCKYFSLGKPNDCLIPNTEHVMDREKNNFCEEFKIKEDLNQDTKKDKKEISRKLFKDDGDQDDKRDFNSLFKD